MEPYCCGLGRLWTLKNSSAQSKQCENSSSNRRPSRKCCAPLRTRRTTCSPSSTPSSTAPHVSVEQTYAAYVSPKKAAFVAWRCEGTPLLVSQVWSSFPVLAEKGSHLSRIATSRLPTHIPDFTAVEGDLRDDFWGFRTSLFVPLLKDNEIVGMISLGRKQVQPFTDKQISLF